MIHRLRTLSLEECSLVAEYLDICNVVSSGAAQEEDWLDRMIFIFQEIEGPLCQDLEVGASVLPPMDTWARCHITQKSGS
jgi:hypothetical protein